MIRIISNSNDSNDKDDNNNNEYNNNKNNDKIPIYVGRIFTPSTQNGEFPIT